MKAVYACWRGAPNADIAGVALGPMIDWQHLSPDGDAVYHPKLDDTDRRRLRRHWAGKVSRTRYRPA